jgi:dihydroorotate dehydrogenase electron transfer subunit
MIDEKATVVSNINIAPDYYQLQLDCSIGFKRARPGQFVMLGLTQTNAPLLRRPFSIHRLINHQSGSLKLEILYKVVGEATQLMALLNEGDRLDMLGPLGRGYRLAEPKQSVYLVGGGSGIASLVFLADALAENGADLKQSIAFIGGRSADDILCQNHFSDLGMAVQITTDDGSSGDQCLITHPLEVALADNTKPPDIIYACGPTAMLACIQGIVEKYTISCQISIETLMACGMGACLGCAVTSTDDAAAYLHVCKDGPVFDADQIRL